MLARTTGVILAGGLGTRLKSVVADRPKVLAPVGGRPFITYLLAELERVSLPHVVLLTGHLAEQVQHTLGHWFGRMRLSYSVEEEPMGTAGAVRAALAYFESENVLLLNGDSRCRIEWQAFASCHEQKQADATLVLSRTSDAARFGLVTVNGQGRIIRFREKESVGGHGLVNAGIYLIHRELIETLPSTYPLSLERDVLPQWAAARRVYGYEADGGLLDIGTPESYALAERTLPELTHS